jgi:hypothetical protein
MDSTEKCDPDIGGFSWLCQPQMMPKKLRMGALAFFQIKVNWSRKG